jgi:hypothetical protein
MGAVFVFKYACIDIYELVALFSIKLSEEAIL